YCELGRIRRGTDDDMALVGQNVVQPVGPALVQGVTQKVVSVDHLRFRQPSRPVVVEVANQFLLLAIDAEDRQTLVAEGVDEDVEVTKLPVSVAVVRSGEALDIDVQV